MPSLQNFYTSRDNNANASTYVGQLDRLWYNPDLNSIYVSDGNTPGGIPVGLATSANAIFNNITVNGSVLGDLNITGNISAAANNKIGGIAPGPGVFISNIGLLTIDSANLPVSFGNFYANNNILSIVNMNENMILETQGSAEIQMIGNIGFYQFDGTGAPSGQYFYASKDGQLTIYVPAADPAAGAVKIIGTASGNFSPPLNTGVMLQITGQNNDASRLYNDSVGGFAAFVGRRINGTVASPTPVLAGQEIIRISSTGYNGNTIPGTAGARIVFQAMEDFTPTTNGSNLSFWATAVGSNTLAQVATVDVANGVNATKFTTSGTISATGNITGGNLVLSSGGLLSSTGLISTTGNISAGNVSATGNVTGGNIIATTAVSATNYSGTTVSVTGNVTAGNLVTANTVINNGISTTGNISAGNVISYVTLPAGTATKAALRFTAGNILNPPAPGVMSYDGKFFYATPQGAERGLIVTEQVYILNTDYALINQADVQSMFGVSASVSDNTRYAYVINAVIYKTANNITLSFALDGNAVLSSHTYQTSTTAAATLGTLSSPSVLKNSQTSGFTTPVVVTGALNGTGYYSLQVTGVISVTTGGTWNPLIAFSGLPGAGSFVAGGSSVELWPLGTANTTVSIGNWT